MRMDELKKYTPVVIIGFVWKFYNEWLSTMGLEHSLFSQIISTLLLLCIIVSAVFVFFEKKVITKYVIAVIAVFSIGYISLPVIGNTQKEEQVKRDILEEGQKEKDIAKQKNIKPASDSSEMIVRLENPEEFDISSDVVVRMGIVPFEANNIMEDKVLWIRSKNKNGIKAKGSQLYNFGVLPNIPQVTFLVITIQSDQLPGGLLYDMYYTWNGGKNWALLRENLGNVDVEQVRNIQSFVDHIKQ